MKAAIVITTIYKNKIIEMLCRNIKKFKHVDDTSIIVIPDKKTPDAVYKDCKTFKKKGFHIICPALEEQEKFLKKINLYPEFIPYNSDNRRNIGYLMMLESSDILISMDNDNYPSEDDFVGFHKNTFKRRMSYSTVTSSSKWYNPMEMLDYKVESPKVLYPRGFPYKYRHLKHKYNFRLKKIDPKDISLNAGLWLEDPDIDGITWIVSPAKANTVKKNFQDVILEDDVWAPINSQNTALRRDAVAAYYFLKMNYPINGMIIDRYGDIFSGFFVEKCIKSLGKKIKFGRPLTIHRRNAHNHFKDITGELACIIILEEMIDWLMEVDLEGNSFHDVYESLSYQIEEAVEKEMKGFIWTDEVKAYFHYIAFHMRKWLSAYRLISGYSE